MKFTAEQFELPAIAHRVNEYRPLTYLACPYSDPRDFVREQRFEACTLATVWLIKNHGLNVFSPITHSHPLHERGLAGNWEFWKRIDTEYLNCSNRLVVLAIPGWKESTGVTAEIKIAQEQNISAGQLHDYRFVNEKDL
jgi:hypothetical protein